MSKKIKNITESVDFRMSQLASRKATKEELEVIADYNQLLSKVLFTSSTKEVMTNGLYADEDKYNEKLAEYEARMAEKMPEWMAKECKAFGVKYPSDKVTLNVRLGNVLFDLFRQGSVEPQAPLAQALYRKKALDYAEVLDKEEFEIPAEVGKAAERMLMDDKLWEECIVSAWCEVSSENEDEESKKVGMTLKTGGLMQYKEILGGLLASFMPESVIKSSKGK